MAEVLPTEILMGRRGGWLPDTLIEEIGLSPAQLMPALGRKLRREAALR